MGAESHLDQARKGAVPANEAFINATLFHVDAIRRAIKTVVIYDEPPVRTAESQSEPVSTFLEPATLDVATPGTELPASDTVTGINVYRPLGEILVDMGAADAGAIQLALEIQEKPLGELLVESGAASRENVTKALEKQRSLEAKPAEPAGAEVQRKEIRVDTAKLDKLFDLVGELITAEAMVVNSPDLKGLKLDHFERAYSALNKISREIQETTMAIRMIPMDGLFHKMTRLVRDLTRKFGKPVDFRVSGQDTEMDKNVIEQISDPLVHILRNSIDHGLEFPAERKAAGKPEAGTVTLDARYEGSEIWVSIRDDGKGLNKEKILAKATERGLLKVDPSTLEDKDIWAFIFEPGFSTAQVVSEVSGRGVGMDVVRKNLDRIRGAVDVRSVAGKETEFVLRIPLTMAIIEGITVRVGPNYYSIPLNDILEFFKARPDQITRTADGGELVSLRGEILPLAKLWQVFEIKGAMEKPEDGILLVVNAGGRKAGLLIDEVLGNQQIVIKPLSEFLGKVDGVSGCSILGDGTVSFIIDTGRLLSLVLE
jgi:two-component system chemotaxis sensor kinase CheA